MAEVCYRPCRDSDEAAINQSFSEVFGLQRPLEEWRWKFQSEPEGRFVMIAVDEAGHVLAHYGAVPVRMRIGDLSLRAGQIVDVFSRPNVRQGLSAGRVFLTTVDTFYRDFCVTGLIGLCYGFPSERPLKLGALRSGYAQVPPQRIHVLRRSSHGRVWRLDRHDVRAGFQPDAVDALWQRAHDRYRVAAVRDAAWLRRRLTGRPGVDYQHFVAFRRDIPVGLAVVRSNANVVQWVELVWDGEDRRCLLALDRAVTSFAHRARTERIELWLDGDRTATVVRPLLAAIDPSMVSGTLYVTMSDGDLV
jgi:hypothetical protein